MHRQSIQNALSSLPLGGLRYFEQIDSTNDEAARWADSGAPDLSLVVADEQTAGRGRNGHKWFTPPASALAFSLLIRNVPATAPSGAYSLPSQTTLSRLTALGALAVCEALRQSYGLPAAIKWPNDVLLERCKVAGVLAETHWQADQLTALILGIGINIAPSSVPQESEQAFPATCVETVLGRSLPREQLLRSVLQHLLAWQARLEHAEFLRAWEEQLAFRGDWVYLSTKATASEFRAYRAQVLGLDSLGGLRLQDETGNVSTVYSGEVRLRPIAPG